ncbi:MAG: P-loop containing nucleoside triphosphate hydrolase protein [Podila humilis]|nr:MAG: P-loop containing nucleoside triphosphate hydrolase protein [Podila humilis]
MVNSIPNPPPPPPLKAAMAALSISDSEPSASALPFTVTGNLPTDAIFEFSEPSKSSSASAPASSPSALSVPLKFVVSRYLGSTTQLRSLAVDRLYLILGRLRCLHYALDRYNQGLVSQSEAFRQYWKHYTLGQLSGFGFQIASSLQSIVIEGLPEMIEKVEEIYAQEIKAARDMIEGGNITFDGLSELFHPSVPVKGVTALGGTPGIFLVTEYYFEERRSLLGMERSFHWTMEFVTSLGNHFTVARFTEILSGWTGFRARSLSELTYVPLRLEEREGLQRRGEKYARIAAGGAQFLTYSPNTFFMHGMSSNSLGGKLMSKSGGSQLSSGGRIMVDPARGALLGHHASQGMDEPTQAMIQLAARYRRWLNTRSTTSGVSSAVGQETLILWESVPEEMAIFCWPAVVGFSFSAKAWGHVLTSGLDPIAFHDQAFDQLVLPAERKMLIRALVRFGGEDNTQDIIGGKRGGSVFLLHGPPGVGKTLTAEAIAEVLHRPLYYVTMGELGMTPDEMERRLGDVLDLCADWNALVLLDEADVFLEQRSTSDIVRNAMVCVMLRLLEYHPGILFLTTNRVRTFDPAFESRVTVAMRYENLTEDARVQIWKNLLGRVTVTVESNSLDYELLGQHVLNGRQIKNAVRLAVALAREQQSAVSQALLDTTLRIVNVGRQDMQTDDSWIAK